MILDSTTKSLEVILAGAVATAQPVWYAAFADHTAVAFTPGASDGLTNGVTAVTAVAAPVSGVQRQIKLFSLFNNDTAAVTATVRINNNATLRIVVKITLAVGDTLEYDPSNGWKVITTGGTVKSGISPAGATGEIQYNAGGGSLGASPNLAWGIVNNQLLLGDGTVALPVVSFVLDSDTGLYRIGADIIGAATAGVERLRLTSSSIAHAAGVTHQMLGQNRFRHLQSMVRVFQSVALSIPNAAFTALTWNSETFDTDNLHSTVTNTDRLTAAIAGKYLVTVNMGFVANATGIRVVRIGKNAATFYGRLDRLGNASDANTLGMTALVDLVANDFVTAEVFQDSGGALNTRDGSADMNLQMVYVGE